MLNPAGALRKSKADLLCRASRLAPTLRARRSASATRTRATAPCSSQSRRLRARRRARQAASAPITSAQRRGVHQAALGPEVVDAARQRHRRLRPEVALEAFAVIADLLDDPVGPCGIQAEELAGVFGDAEEALDARVLVARLLLVDVGLRQSVLFALDHREQRPADDLE